MSAGDYDDLIFVALIDLPLNIFCLVLFAQELLLNNYCTNLNCMIVTDISLPFVGFFAIFEKHSIFFLVLRVWGLVEMLLLNRGHKEGKIKVHIQ